jgi:serine/threonine protein kinase
LAENLNKMVMIKQYLLGKTLGSGVSGKVKIATDKNTGQIYAAKSNLCFILKFKVLNKEYLKKQNMEDDVKREIAIMKLLKHENIVKLYEVLEGPENYYLIIELITGNNI